MTFTLNLRAGALCIGAVFSSNCVASMPTPPVSFEKPADSSTSEPKSESHKSESQPPSGARTATYPAKMVVTLDAPTQALVIKLSFAPCKASGFVYDRNTLTVDVDHKERSITLSGAVAYSERPLQAHEACDEALDPIVISSPEARNEPYIVKNMSAWRGRGGNGITARVVDFRKAQRIEDDIEACLSGDQAKLGNISGIWYLQNDPTRTAELSGNHAMIRSDPVLRVWSGSTMPYFVESERPYSFDLSGFGRVEFRSPSCAAVYAQRTGVQTDFLVRQSVAKD